MKITPKCLRERRNATDDEITTDGIIELVMKGLSDSEFVETSEGKEEGSSFSDEVYMTNLSFAGQTGTSIHLSETDLSNKDTVNAKTEIIKIQEELRREEIEALIDSFEGSSIGWLMSFLANEMIRLKEQRRLHLFTMLAKQERWHREAREAGLRQKENYLRSKYEEVYVEAQNASLEVAQKYVDEILEVDVKNYAAVEAEEYVVDLARVVDREIDGWIQSFNEVQTPLNYMNLRCHLCNIVIPDTEKVIADLERDADIKYIIDEVLMPEVFRNLESFDIGSIVASHLVDRLIDNDLYIISTEESSDEDTLIFPDLHESTKEAHAIVRKMIRRAVPGRRWRTPAEREEDENLKDIVDDILDKVQDSQMAGHPDFMATDFALKPEIFDFKKGSMERGAGEGESSSLGSDLEVTQVTSTFDKPAAGSESAIKLLESNEVLLLLDPDNISIDNEVVEMVQYNSPVEQSHSSFEVESIRNTHSIHLSTRFSFLQRYVSTHEIDQARSPSVDTEAESRADSATNVVNKVVDELLDEVVEDVNDVTGYGEDNYLYDDDGFYGYEAEDMTEMIGEHEEREYAQASSRLEEEQMAEEEVSGNQLPNIEGRFWIT